MDLVGISTFSTICVPLLMVLVSLLLISKQRNKAASPPKNNLPPGPRKLPFIGHLHLLSGSKPPHCILSDLAKKHGPLMHLQLGEIPTLVVSSSKTAQLFLKTHDIAFATRPQLVAAEVMSNGYKDIAFAPYGEHWRQLRKICTLQLLSAKRVHAFRPIRENEFTDMCRGIASQAGSTVNLTKKIDSAMYDIITLSSFGSKTNDQARFSNILRESTLVASGFNLVDVFPSVILFGKMSGLRKKMEGLYQESENIILKIINERKSQIANSIQGGGEKEEDLLDVLLKLAEDAHVTTLSTTKDIVPILQDIFSAGIELSATTVEWAMSEMLKKPSVLKKAQDEVRQVFDGKTHMVDENHFNELYYLKLVIKETLRMHPPAPLLLPRECREQCTINGYDILQKTRVLVNAWAIGRDSTYWEDPDSFDPDRFLGNDIDYKGNDFHFIPFGAGRRICPGMSYGLANIELPLAMFLYHFDWILPCGIKSEEMDMTETFGLTAKRMSTLCVIPVVRRPLPVK